MILIKPFVIEDENNVAVIHCNAGKGRTGTAISCLLLLSNFVSNMEDAIKFYGNQRFHSGTGVTQPC
jgi:phosphatidylinositol-3,4,5-trisphosphate 3-phosphatase/dual-specificity protein phosphatase PTEN